MIRHECFVCGKIWHCRGRSCSISGNHNCICDTCFGISKNSAFLFKFKSRCREVKEKVWRIA